MDTIEDIPKLVPAINVAVAERNNPNGKNLRALLRSETPPMINLEIP